MRHVLQLSPRGHATTACTRCGVRARLSDVLMGGFEMEDCTARIGEDGRLREAEHYRLGPYPFGHGVVDE